MARQKENLKRVFCTRVKKHVLAESGSGEFEVNVEVRCQGDLTPPNCEFWLTDCSRELVILSKPVKVATPN